MALLGLFIGSLAGLWLVKDFSFVSLLSGGVLFTVGFFLSYRQGVLKMELIGLALGAVLGSLRFLPCPNGGELRGIVIEAKNSYFILFDGLHKYYVYEKNSLREVGDVLCLHGKLEGLTFPSYESRFDFKAYLETKGILRSYYAKSIDVVFLRPIRLREKELAFLTYFRGETKALLDAVLFSHRDSASESMSLATGLGIVGLFSSSGMLYSLTNRAVEKFFSLRLEERRSKEITLGFGSVLLLLLPFKIGICRSYLMRLFSYLNTYHLKQKFLYLEMLSLVGMILIGFDVSNAYQLGYLLGFCLCFSNYFTSCIVNRNKREYRTFIRLLLVYIVIFPISLSGGRIHFLYPFFSTLLIPCLALFAFLGWFSFLSVPFHSILSGYSSFLLIGLKSMAKLDFAIGLAAPSSFALTLYYFLLFFILYFWSMGYIGMVRNIYIAIMAVYSISLVPVVPLFSQEVTFINVGQGDSILIRDGFHAALLDTGGNLSFDMAEEVLIPYLRKRRIYHLDYLIASHGDFDHIGAKDSLLSNFSVGKYIDAVDSFPLTFGRITLTNYNVFDVPGENESSLVLGANIMGKNWLFMGDAPEAIEKKIITKFPNIDCDILKAGHHGSKTSSSKAFLEKVTPETAIISVGCRNQYGHPDKEVIDRFLALGIKIRRTDEEGTITYQSFAPPTI